MAEARMDQTQLHQPRSAFFLSNRPIFVAILLFASLIRFWNISHTAIYSVDEGRYLLDADAKRTELGVWAAIAAGKWREMAHGEPFYLADLLPRAAAELSRCAPFLPKVLFSWLVGLVMCATGFAVWAGNEIGRAHV